MPDMDPTAELFVDDRGHGDPVVLLHSGGMSSRQWRSLADRLAARYRVVAPDFTGSGTNPPWPDDAPFHYGVDVDAVASVLRRLDRPAHVVGHSYGGLVALTLARSHLDRVRSVAVYDPVAFGVLHDPADEAALADLAAAERNPIFTDEARGGGEEWMEAFIGYWNGSGAWQALPKASREQFLRVGRKVFREVSSLMADRTPATDYEVVSVPVLVLAGERSPFAARRAAQRLAASMPNARLAIVAGAGHMGPLTHGAFVADAIEAHLSAA